MLKFPGEEERTREVQKNLREQFEFVERAYEFAAMINLEELLKRPTVPDNVSTAIAALILQTFRMYRTIFEECSRAEGFCARLPLRCLFETAMAIAFILNPNVHMRAVTKPDGKGGIKRDSKGRPKAHAEIVPPAEVSPQNSLISQFRARMYLGYGYLKADKNAEECDADPSLAKFSAAVKASVDSQGVDHFGNLLGPEWAYICRSSYSGLTVKQLAAMLEPSTLIWYQMIYGLDSEIIHGTAALLLVTAEGKALATTSNDGFVFSTLHGAALLFLAIFAAVNESIPLPTELSETLTQLRDECTNVFKADKAPAQS